MYRWSLPKQTQIRGKTYDLHTDYRDILEIFAYFQDPELPDYLKWKIALGLFYTAPVPEADQAEAAEYLAEFLAGGRKEEAAPGPRLLDWQQDGDIIAAEINAVAGQEVRALPYVHWWTFLGWFHAIGQGQLSTLVAIRRKLARGEKLEDWEKEFYRENKARVVLKPRLSREEQAEKERLEKLLGK